jgi:hypothetical protein
LLVCETREFFHRCLAERGPNRDIAKAEFVAYREGFCPDKASHFPNSTINSPTLAGQTFPAPGTVRPHAVKEGQYGPHHRRHRTVLRAFALRSCHGHTQAITASADISVRDIAR